MPTPTKGPRLGGSPAHERLMLANLATSLFQHGKITTTETKAKRLRPLAEQLITKAKRGDLHSRRRVLTVVRDKDVVFALFDEIAPRFANRPRRLHPDRQDRPPQGRRRSDGDHRAGRGAGRGRAGAGQGEQGRRPQGRRAADTVAALAGEDDDAAARRPADVDAGAAARPPTSRRPRTPSRRAGRRKA